LIGNSAASGANATEQKAPVNKAIALSIVDKHCSHMDLLTRAQEGQVAFHEERSSSEIPHVRFDMGSMRSMRSGHPLSMGAEEFGTSVQLSSPV